MIPGFCVFVVVVKINRKKKKKKERDSLFHPVLEATDTGCRRNETNKRINLLEQTRTSSSFVFSLQSSLKKREEKKVSVCKISVIKRSEHIDLATV